MTRTREGMTSDHRSTVLTGDNDPHARGERGIPDFSDAIKKGLPYPSNFPCILRESVR